jgi:asparagine synthetase B (glutamine-hydrolysing)
MDQLEKATSEIEILSILQEIEGPFAFIYYKPASKKIWFSRDCLGRRSLLWYRSTDGPFMLSSVGKAPQFEEDNEKEDGKWEEVPANGIYCIDLAAAGQESEEDGKLIPQACGMPIKLYPWTYSDPEEKLENLQASQLVCSLISELLYRNLIPLFLFS